MTAISGETSLTKLTVLAEEAAASGNWWEEDSLDHRHTLALPTRVLAILDQAGIRTVEDLKSAGPTRLRKLEGIGKLAFNQIINLLRALDRHPANGSKGNG
jgi:DNA-directed RNA polymerase alpha subunit